MGTFEATFKQVPSCNAKVLIARGKLTDKHGKAKLTLSCPHGYIYCHGTVTLTTIKRFSSNGAKHKGKRLKLGSAQFRISNGRSKTLTIKLSSKALKEIGSIGSVQVLISVSDHDAAGHRASTTHKTKLKLTKKHKK